MTEQLTIAPATEAPPRHRWRAYFWVLLGIAATAALAWWLVQPKTGKEAVGKGKRPAATVGIGMVTKGDLPVVMSAIGTVTPLATVTVRPQVSGQLVEINFREGQTVAKNAVLARIDPRPFALAIDQAKATLQRDEALLQNNQTDLARYQTLAKQDSIAEQQVTTQAAAVHQQAAVVANDRALLKAAQLNLTYSVVSAPVSGRVGLRQVDVGNYVTAGQATGIVVLTRLHPIDVLFALPQDAAPQLTARMRSGAAVPVSIYDRSHTTLLASGKFLTLDNQIDTTTGTIKAKARFDNNDGALTPNQFVNADTVVDVLHDVAIAPTSAVRHGSKVDFVYVVDAQKTAHVRKITTGAAKGEQVAVLSGLEPGEKLVTEGGDSLSDGAKVKLPGDKSSHTWPGGGAGRRHRG
jgi:membrane fusion protein, multidrug efflux system